MRANTGHIETLEHAVVDSAALRENNKEASMADGYGEMNLATIGQPLGRFAKLALAIDISLVMPLFVALEKVHIRSALICSDVSSRAVGRACEVDRQIRSWQHNRTKIRSELTFPLTYTMPL
jgi:hypothetical protein